MSEHLLNTLRHLPSETLIMEQERVTETIAKLVLKQELISQIFAERTDSNKL